MTRSTRPIHAPKQMIPIAKGATIAPTAIAAGGLLIGLWGCAFAVDDFSELVEIRETSVHRVLEIDQNGNVLVEGSVESVDHDCHISQVRCNLRVYVDDVSVSIFPSQSSEGDPCTDQCVLEEYSRVSPGDRIRAYGKYFGFGQVSVCGDRGFYIEVLMAQD